MSGLAWTPDGRSLVYGAQTFYAHHLWRVSSDGDGPPERLEVAGLGARRPALVPARNRLVFDRLTYDPDIYRFSLRAPPRATIVSSFADFNASFSPDGTRIVYASSRSGDAGDIWVAAADGSGPQRLTGDMAGAHASPQWSPDGHVIAFASRGADGQTQIWTVDADGGNRRQITRGPGDHLFPSWSRDGASIYFTKVDGTGPNIWRIAARGGRDVQVTREGGDRGFESADRKSLVYRPRWDRSGTPLLTMPLAGGSTRQLVECMYGFSVGSKDVFYYPCRADVSEWTMTHSGTSGRSGDRSSDRSGPSARKRQRSRSLLGSKFFA